MAKNYRARRNTQAKEEKKLEKAPFSFQLDACVVMFPLLYQLNIVQAHGLLCNTCLSPLLMGQWRSSTDALSEGEWQPRLYRRGEDQLRSSCCRVFVTPNELDVMRSIWLPSSVSSIFRVWHGYAFCCNIAPHSLCVLFYSIELHFLWLLTRLFSSWAFSLESMFIF